MVGLKSFAGRISHPGRWFLATGILFAMAVAWQPEAGAQGTPQAVPDTLRVLEQEVAADSSYENLYRLGVAYLDRDRAVEAVRIFRRCTELKPKEIKSWVNYGASQDAIGHGGDARVAYRQALGIDSDDEIALCRLSASLYAGSYRSAAMDTLRLTIRKHPRSYCAYFTLGVAFADAQIYEEAIRAWEKVVEFAPNTPEAQSATESISTLRQLLRAQ
jgi:tetratricopeptide (TPR) repeat protein